MEVNNLTNYNTDIYLDKPPIVSIIVATYRRDSTLEKALLSLENQTYKNIEIVVVDDNADDFWNKKVSNIISSIRLKSTKPYIYMKNQSNKGSANTRNIGIKAATGQYVSFLDDDDIYLPNKINSQVEHMIEKKSDFSLTDLNLYNENDKLVEKRNRNYIKEYDKESLLKYHLMYHMTGTDTMMFKKDYLLEIGGFPSIDIGDEFYLQLKAIDAGGKFSYLPECNVKAYVHTETEGLSSGESKVKGENALFEYKKTYFDKLDIQNIRYIKMRHYAVLAFAEVRRKNYLVFLKNAIYSFSSSPLECIRLLTNLQKGAK